MKRIFNKSFDIEGIEHFRVMRLTMMSKIFPLGNFTTGPGGKCLLALAVLHFVGRPVFWFLTRYEERLFPIIQGIRRMRGRV